MLYLSGSRKRGKGLPLLKTFSSAILALTVSVAVSAQPQITEPRTNFDSTNKVFRLDGGGVSYIFGVNPKGELQQIYWGGRLAATDSFPQAAPWPDWASFDTSYTTTPQEYASWGAGLFVEPALKISLADGDRDLVLHYQSYSEAPDGFDVVLKDIHYEIYVTLHYAIDKESGILARSAIIENREPKAVTVEQAAAASWSLPAGHYTLNYLTGRWAGEWNLTQEKLQPGERVIEKPPRLDRPPGESMVCNSERRGQRGAGRGLVRRAGLERFLAHHHRAGPVGNRARHRRLQSLRLRLRTALWRAAGDTDLLRRLCGARAGRGIAAAASLRVGAHSAANRGHGQPAAAQAEAGDLQLVGGNRIQCQRGRTDGAGGEGRGAGH